MSWFRRRLVTEGFICWCALFSECVVDSIYAQETFIDVAVLVQRVIEEARRDPEHQFKIIGPLKGTPGVTRFLRAYIDETEIKEALIVSLGWEEDPDNLRLLGEIMVRDRESHGARCVNIILNFSDKFLRENLSVIFDHLVDYARLDASKSGGPIFGSGTIFGLNGHRALLVMLKSGLNKEYCTRIRALRYDFRKPRTCLYADVLLYLYGDDDSALKRILTYLNSEDPRMVGYALEAICISRKKELGAYLMALLDDTRIVRNLAAGVHRSPVINQTVRDLAAGVLEYLLMDTPFEEPYMMLFRCPRLGSILNVQEIDEIRARYLKWAEPRSK